MWLSTFRIDYPIIYFQYDGKERIIVVPINLRWSISATEIGERCKSMPKINYEICVNLFQLLK